MVLQFVFYFTLFHILFILLSFSWINQIYFSSFLLLIVIFSLFLYELHRLYELLYSILLLSYPKCVYWDVSPLLLIQGAFSAASVWRSSVLSALLFLLTEDNEAANTWNYRLCMAKDSGDFIASRAFHTHGEKLGLCTRCFFLCFRFSSSPLLERDEGDP